MIIFLVWLFTLFQLLPSFPGHSVVSHGGIVRMDTTRKSIFLVFTGHEFADGGDTITAVLRKHHIHASFFFTGDFYRNPGYSRLISTLRDDGHYLGPHSDQHLLYASWENRDSSLVTRGQLQKDLLDNYAAMVSYGLSRDRSPYFIPPYEWYNAAVAGWCAEIGVTIVNFTPGTTSNADYTTPEMGQRYVPSDSIVRRILSVEQQSARGLNGFLLLMHIGTAPTRTDKLYYRLDSLLDTLRTRGYAFRAFGE